MKQDESGSWTEGETDFFPLTMLVPEVPGLEQERCLPRAAAKRSDMVSRVSVRKANRAKDSMIKKLVLLISPD